MHPKDRAWKQYKETRDLIRRQGCTRKELDNPTEANVRKCMREMRATARVGENFKRQAEFLGEDSNLDKHRRRQ